LTESSCPNCGAARAAKFCAVCGQSQKTYLRASWVIFADVVREAFEIDSRLLRTVAALLFKPGYLSREFSNDRRASYVSPGRLYLAVSVVFFGVLAIVPDNDFITVDIEAAAQIQAAPDHEELEVEARAREFLADPQEAYQQLVANLPIAMFLMLPLYAAWLKCLYWRRFYAEHLVFALHLHAFLFALGTVILLLPDKATNGQGVMSDTLTGIGVFMNGTLKLLAAAYYLVALHTMYGQHWPGTAFKFVVANAGHGVILMAGTVVAVLAAIFA